jgi:GDP-mannose 6-dehydrogenase
MRISVFGLGYVGTVCAACLAERGHTVIGVDKAESKVNAIQAGHSPVIERGVNELIQNGVRRRKLTATTDPDEAVSSTDLSIICVGTPSQTNGALSLDAIETVSSEIGGAIRTKNTRHEVVIRSTVLPGTTRTVVVPLMVETSGKQPGDGFGVAFNPEFMREGNSVADFNAPPKTIVGALDDRSSAVVLGLYQGVPGPKIKTKVETAELVKYVDNAWHALKVTFANEIGVISSALGMDSHDVMGIFCEDKRLNISTAYLRPGFAFGGSCLPKDLRALTYLGRKLDLWLPVLNNVLESNQMLLERGLNWILSQSKRRIAFLGISFKSGTDDVRESPFVELAERILGKGCGLRIFDPNVQLAHLLGGNKNYLMSMLPHITELLVPRIEDAINWAEVIVITSADPIYANVLANLRSDQVILDFAGIPPAGEEALHLYFHERGTLQWPEGTATDAHKPTERFESAATQAVADPTPQTLSEAIVSLLEDGAARERMPPPLLGVEEGRISTNRNEPDFPEPSPCTGHSY